MTAAGPRLSALWPLVLLTIFIGTFQRTPMDADSSAPPAECDEVPTQGPRDDTSLLERCLGLEPENAALLVSLGRIHQSSGRVREAERLYRRALTIDPSSSDIHLRLGEVLLARGDAQEARREGEAALRWRPNSAAAIRLVARASAPAGPP